MTPDELRLEESHAWMDRALRDLKAARLLVAGAAYAEALFHSQQAAEKALKGFLTFHQRRFGKTHDLGELGPECLALDTSLAVVLAAAESLTQFAWRFRYPGVGFEPGAEEAADGLEKAELRQPSAR